MKTLDVKNLSRDDLIAIIRIIEASTPPADTSCNELGISIAEAAWRTYLDSDGSLYRNDQTNSIIDLRLQGAFFIPGKDTIMTSENDDDLTLLHFIVDYIRCSEDENYFNTHWLCTRKSIQASAVEVAEQRYEDWKAKELSARDAREKGYTR